MSDFFGLIMYVSVVACFLWFISEVVSALYLRNKKNQMKQEIADNINTVKALMENIVMMRVEKHGNEFFVYNSGTDEFICQGKTVEECGDLFLKKYPGKKGMIFEGGELFLEEYENAK